MSSHRHDPQQPEGWGARLPDQKGWTAQVVVPSPLAPRPPGASAQTEPGGALEGQGGQGVLGCCPVLTQWARFLWSQEVLG